MSKYPDGFEFDFYTLSANVPEAELIQSMVGEIGIKMNTRRYFQQICSAICTALMKMKTATDHIRRLALAGYLTISTLWAI